MPRSKVYAQGASGNWQIRFPPEEDEYYRRRANIGGLSRSEFIRQMVAKGILSESVDELEERITSTIKPLQEAIENINTKQNAGGLSPTVLLALFTSVELLTAIVEQKSAKELYAAQERAQLKVAKELAQDGK